ncbi:MAG: thiol-disulfide oxidoreductase DCC family protein [Ignavibacteriae bacterium]|nr:MAG: thiol-disulfide oxidoreductase DCC family protein [Ignavibacteriota bacterium]
MNPPVVIFDGVCNLCNATVDFLIRNDRTGTILFGSFQEDAGRALLSQYGVFAAPETVYFIENGILYIESTAILRLTRYLPWTWRWLLLGRLIPRPLRDRFYRWVSRNRYRWFGKRSSCRLPSAEDMKRFI